MCLVDFDQKYKNPKSVNFFTPKKRICSNKAWFFYSIIYYRKNSRVKSMVFTFVSSKVVIFYIEIRYFVVFFSRSEMSEKIHEFNFSGQNY